MRRTSAAIFSTMAAGVPAGATRPMLNTASMSFTPASLNVGTSGRASYVLLMKRPGP
jgi:hypothetical protein